MDISTRKEGNGSGSGDSLFKTFSNEDCVLPFDTTEFKVIAGVRAFIGVLLVVVCVVVTVLLFVLKKHHFFDQRLVLYLAVACFLHSISYIVGRVDFDERPLHDPYCYFAGFFETYTSCLELLAVLSVSLNMYVFVVLHVPRGRLECVYLCCIIALPLLWCWVPFAYQEYATAGPWCGIKSLESDCGVSESGNLLKLLVWHLPVFVFAISTLFVAIAVLVTLRRISLQNKLCSPRRTIEQPMVRKGILSGPIIYFLLKAPIFATDVYDYVNPADPLDVLWYIRVFTSPLAGAIILVMFFLDAETRRRVKLSSCKAAMVTCCCRCRRKEEVTSYSCEYHPAYGDSMEGAAMRRKIENRKSLLQDLQAALS